MKTIDVDIQSSARVIVDAQPAARPRDATVWPHDLFTFDDPFDARQSS